MLEWISALQQVRNEGDRAGLIYVWHHFGSETRRK